MPFQHLNFRIFDTILIETQIKEIKKMKILDLKIDNIKTVFSSLFENKLLWRRMQSIPSLEAKNQRIRIYTKLKT